MKINLRFASCQEYLGEIENGEMEVPDNCDIDGLLSFLEKKYERTGIPDLPKYIAFMINGKSAQHTDVIPDGAMVIILRKIYGG